MAVYKVCFDLRCSKDIDLKTKKSQFETVGDLQHLIYLGINNVYAKRGNQVQIANTKITKEK